MARGFVFRDKGWTRIQRELAMLVRKVVEVGIQDDGTHHDGTPVAAIGAFNEYGTARVPERSFMRSTFDEEARSLSKDMGRLAGGVATLAISAAQAADAIGLKHEGQIQKKITSLKTPPNAPSTIRRKGSSNPLIDTGLMRQSIRFVVKG